MKNTLDEVDLSLKAIEAYKKFIRDNLPRILEKNQVNQEDLPDSDAEIKEDGSLAIFTLLPNGKGRIEFIVPKGQWLQRNRN